MLMFAKGSHICFQQKQLKQWQPFMPSVLRGKTVGIIGLGGIGREIARLSKAFGMHVMAARRTVKKSGRARNVDEAFSVRELPRLLRKSDFVVLALPLTHETHKIIGEEQLRLMKPTAYLVNIARGKVVDEPALVSALRENRIAGAALDVFEVEPLPAASPLWELSNVILTPHIAGGMDRYIEQATDIFCENLKRYLAGERLTRVVNKTKGY
jgi:phosphoglycerate dehydrogenase-like enzyme